MQHGQRFVKIVEEALKSVPEVSSDTVQKMLDSHDAFYLIDVREDSEWSNGHLPNAIHLSKGIIEVKIENIIPDVDAPLVLYCGGGYRSALAALNLQKMGYTNVKSLNEGFRGWRESGKKVVI